MPYKNYIIIVDIITDTPPRDVVQSKFLIDSLEIPLDGEVSSGYGLSNSLIFSFKNSTDLHLYELHNNRILQRWVKRLPSKHKTNCRKYVDKNGDIFLQSDVDDVLIYQPAQLLESSSPLPPQLATVPCIHTQRRKMMTGITKDGVFFANWGQDAKTQTQKQTMSYETTMGKIIHNFDSLTYETREFLRLCYEPISKKSAITSRDRKTMDIFDSKGKVMENRKAYFATTSHKSYL